ncbi:hypothetical protein [Gordonia sp. (in: high G+C Gram-positive bacteria)]|uniref:hypothetical protein n=1 Tax=Gordonia sp. (in: high G+C Gram-positive bacteria) TaxID=84139 RepID=UPI003F9DB6E6
MRARSVSLTAAAVGSAVMGAAAVLAPLGVTGEAAAEPSTTCTMTYLNPNVSPLPLQATTVLRANADGGGKMTITLKTDAVSIIGYHQDVSFTWANLDTGKNGGEQTSKRVVGPNNTLEFPGVKTGVGRITFVASASNTSSLDPTHLTSGQCTAEQKAF